MGESWVTNGTEFPVGPPGEYLLPEFGEHEGCNYRATKVEGSYGPVWFCNKCGWAEMIRPTLLDKANAENKRLREALRKVEYLGSQAQSNAAVHMGMIARAALTASPKCDRCGGTGVARDAYGRPTDDDCPACQAVLVASSHPITKETP